MKTALSPVEHLGKFERLQLVEDLWDEFAAESAGEPAGESRPEVLDELERRAAWRACRWAWAVGSTAPGMAAGAGAGGVAGWGAAAR